MKIAINQPYFYPYHVYFELIKHVDLFILYPDIQYIKQRWINRNRIRSNNGWDYLIVPIKKAPFKTLIRDIKIADEDWLGLHKKKLFNTYGQKIKDHPLFEVFCRTALTTNLSDLLISSIKKTCKVLGITTKIIDFTTSVQGRNERIFNICRKFNATTYCNLPGGRNLYNEEYFKKQNINLEFFESNKFENKLSILDLCFGDNVYEL